MENRPFFEPYFNNIPPAYTQPLPNISNNIPPTMSPQDYFLEQYYYYRCLNERLDYMAKQKEYDAKYGQKN